MKDEVLAKFDRWVSDASEAWLSTPIYPPFLVEIRNAAEALAQERVRQAFLDELACDAKFMDDLTNMTREELIIRVRGYRLIHQGKPRP